MLLACPRMVIHTAIGVMYACRSPSNTRLFADHFKQMYEDVMTVMRIRTFQLIILQVLVLHADSSKVTFAIRAAFILWQDERSLVSDDACCMHSERCQVSSV